MIGKTDLRTSVFQVTFEPIRAAVGTTSDSDLHRQSIGALTL